MGCRCSPPPAAAAGSLCPVLALPRHTQRTWDWWTLSLPAPLPGLWALAAGPGHLPGACTLAAAGFGMGQGPQGGQELEVSGAGPQLPGKWSWVGA